MQKNNPEYTFKKLPFDPNKPRNVVDHLKWLSDLEIIQELDKNRLNYSILLINIDYDNNIGNIIRSSNAFGASQVFIFGRKKFDRRGSVGTEFYTHFKHLKFLEDLKSILTQFDHVVGLDNVVGAQVLKTFTWHPAKKTLIIIGQEGQGIPDYVLEQCHDLVYIHQFGSVRSLNVATAAGIVMNDYCNKVAIE